MKQNKNSNKNMDILKHNIKAQTKQKKQTYKTTKTTNK